jgi:serine/threonine-protein kinase RsbT
VSVERAVEEILGRCMSPILAQSVRRRAQRAIQVPEGALRLSDLPRLQGELAAGVRLFAEPNAQRQALDAVSALAKGSDEPASSPRPAEKIRVELAAEADVVQARSHARALAERLGGDAFAIQRVATAASELARNAVLYAGGGVIEFSPSRPPQRGVWILARDAGPGIGNLDHILSGKYKSRTGLGRGLLGVKRLARSFDVTTGSNGTRIEVEIAL